MNESKYPCNLCGNNNSIVIWDKSAREAKGLRKGLVIRDDNNKIVHDKVVICTKCGLVYTDPKLTPEDLEKFYKEKYREIYNSNNDIDKHMISEAWHSDNATQILYPFIVITSTCCFSLCTTLRNKLTISSSSNVFTSNLVHLPINVGNNF